MHGFLSQGNTPGLGLNLQGSCGSFGRTLDNRDDRSGVLKGLLPGFMKGAVDPKMSSFVEALK